ncbi:hypothetical protein MRX96_025500 [Rhipicephalus microplus]
MYTQKARKIALPKPASTDERSSKATEAVTTWYALPSGRTKNMWSRSKAAVFRNDGSLELQPDNPVRVPCTRLRRQHHCSCHCLMPSQTSTGPQRPGNILLAVATPPDGLMDGATYTLEVKPTKTTVMSSSGALKPGKVFTPKPAKAMDPKVAPRHGHCTDRLPQSKRVHLQDPIQTTFSIVTGTP